MTTITLTEHMKKMLLNGTVTVSTTGNTYVHPLTTATTVPVASASVSVSDDWQAFRNRVMRDMLDATGHAGRTSPRSRMTQLERPARRQPAQAADERRCLPRRHHREPRASRTRSNCRRHWLKSNGCRCDMCVKLRHECGMGTPEVAPKDKRIDEMTHLDWKKCVDAFWPSRGRWE
jgi:hypothetical protein